MSHHSWNEFLLVTAGYAQMQSTKPQTLGYSLNDSPVGLLAWQVEKLRTWSDRRHSNGQLPFDKDFLITNCCLYWLTGNITSSCRLYYEVRHAHEGRQLKQYCKVRQYDIHTIRATTMFSMFTFLHPNQ